MASMRESTPTSFTPETISGVIKSRLIIIGCLLLSAYASFYIFYSTPELSQPRLNREIFVWPLSIGLALLFWQGYQLVQTTETGLKKIIITFGALFSILAVFTDNFHSTDLFGYINRGWQQVHYHLNPYVFTVAEIPNWENDAMITDHWVNNPSPYGFIYMLWVKLQVFLGQGNFTQTVLVFKCFNWLAFIGTGSLIYHLAKKTPTLNPETSLYLWCWNPLILLHLLANAHNDIWMGLGLLLAFTAVFLEQYFWIIPALALATLTKYGAIVILPFALVFLIKHKHYKILALSIALAIAMAVLSAYPFLQDALTSDNGIKLDAIKNNVSVSHSSLHHTLFSMYKQLAENVSGLYPYRPLVKSLLKNGLLLSFASFYFYTLYVRGVKQNNYTKQQLLEDTVVMMFLLICFVSTKYYPWYFGLFYAVTLLLPSNHVLKDTIVLITLFQLLAFTAIGQAHMVNYPVMTLLPVLMYQKRLREFFISFLFSSKATVISK